MPWNSIDPWNAQRHIEMAFRMVNVESDMKFIISARKTEENRRFLEERELNRLVNNPAFRYALYHLELSFESYVL